MNRLIRHQSQFLSRCHLGNIVYLRSFQTKNPYHQPVKNKKKTLEDLIDQGLFKTAAELPSQTIEPTLPEEIKEEEIKTIKLKSVIKFTEEGKNYLQWKESNSNQIKNLKKLNESQLKEFVNKTATEVFGVANLKAIQAESIMNIINAKSSFPPSNFIILSSTGSGKSIIYWLSGILDKGNKDIIQIVISPLISLINDQLFHLSSFGIPAACYYGTRPSASLKTSFFQRIENGEFRNVYITPEKVMSRDFMNLVQKLIPKYKLRFIIDEVHCVSEWGHDFRPDYMKISRLRDKFKEVEFVCTTATATLDTLLDIQQSLQLQDATILRGSLLRSNLRFSVLNKKENYIQDAVAFIKNTWPSSSGIIYCLTKEECERVSTYLQQNKITSGVYHSGINDNKKSQLQEDWVNNKTKVIVATSAFGMGVNKPDVRYVIHTTLPTSLEGYYQQAGRAGRDGSISDCLLYFDIKDRRIAEHVISSSIVAVSEENPLGFQSNYADRKKEKLDDIISWCLNQTRCRVGSFLKFFGQTVDENYSCGICDNCLHRNANKE